MVITFLFCIGDMQKALASPTGYDFLYVFENGTLSKGGATAMASLILVMGLAATFGLLASASRQTWAFARDNGLPFSKYISRVKPILASFEVVLMFEYDRSGRRTHFPPSPRNRPLPRHKRPSHPHHHRLLDCLQRRRLPYHKRPLRNLPSPHRPPHAQARSRRESTLRSLATG